ncbi:hypothetical protein PG984_003452 [Apiospora sp. TS-2023a]
MGLLLHFGKELVRLIVLRVSRFEGYRTPLDDSARLVSLVSYPYLDDFGQLLERKLIQVSTIDPVRPFQYGFDALGVRGDCCAIDKQPGVVQISSPRGVALILIDASPTCTQCIA